QVWRKKDPHQGPAVTKNQWIEVPASKSFVTDVSSEKVNDPVVSKGCDTSNKFSVLEASVGDDSLLDHADMVDCNFDDFSVSRESLKKKLKDKLHALKNSRGRDVP
ncbi:hypothetical protein P3S20_24700, partial [Enterobacter hormaechei]|uniref:hypothetical protein n=1 Tax=Enterobacter hormaechei TaxID=158836 RepID=UPI0023E37A37